MVIKLEEADFSANNIGKITVQRTFKDTTKSVLTKFGITENTTNAVQIALDDFVSALTTANLWGTKIKSLCLPFLSQIAKSGDLTYATMDVIGENRSFFSTSAPASTDNAELRAHGLAVREGGNVIKTVMTDRIGTDNFHLAGYNMDEEDVTTTLSDGTYPNRFVFGEIATVIGLVKCKSGLPALYCTPTTIVDGDSNYKSASCMLIGSVSVTDAENKKGDVVLSVNGQATSETNKSLYRGTMPSAYIFAQYTGATYNDSGTNVNGCLSKASWGLLSVGTALSEDECATYTNAVNALMAIVKTMS